MVKFMWFAFFTLVLQAHSMQDSSPHVVISLQRTQCYGNCPAFKFDIYSDRTVKYKGVAHVEQIGEWTARLTSEQYQSIVREFEEANFFEFADTYYQDISDGPTTYVTYADGDSIKKVMDYYGAPEKLKKLEGKVEQLITEITWKKKTNNQ